MWQKDYLRNILRYPLFSLITLYTEKVVERVPSLSPSIAEVKVAENQSDSKESGRRRFA
jgi:hypothetical protein